MLSILRHRHAYWGWAQQRATIPGLGCFFHLITLCLSKTPLGHQYDGQKIQRTDMVWLAVQDFVKSCSLRRSFGY
jgi:hypothetical protein